MRSLVTEPAAVFPAALGARERLVTYLVGYGVGIGLPLLFGIAFAAAFRRPLLLLLPVPFVLAFGGCYVFRPTHFSVTARDILIGRPVGDRSLPLARVRAMAFPAPDPPGATIGLWRVDGVHGTFGTFWNRRWGRFRMYVTDHHKRVELLLTDGSRTIVSPADPVGFVRAVDAARASATPKVGDRVVLATLPPWVRRLPEPSREVFRFCLGGTFPVSEIDEHGHLVLDVSAEADARFGGHRNEIRVEPEYVRLAAPADHPATR